MCNYRDDDIVCCLLIYCLLGCLLWFGCLYHICMRAGLVVMHPFVCCVMQRSIINEGVVVVVWSLYVDCWWWRLWLLGLLVLVGTFPTSGFHLAFSLFACPWLFGCC